MDFIQTLFANQENLVIKNTIIHKTNKYFKHKPILMFIQPAPWRRFRGWKWNSIASLRLNFNNTRFGEEEAPQQHTLKTPLRTTTTTMCCNQSKFVAGDDEVGWPTFPGGLGGATATSASSRLPLGLHQQTLPNHRDHRVYQFSTEEKQPQFPKVNFCTIYKH